MADTTIKRNLTYSLLIFFLFSVSARSTENVTLQFPDKTSAGNDTEVQKKEKFAFGVK